MSLCFSSVLILCISFNLQTTQTASQSGAEVTTIFKCNDPFNARRNSNTERHSVTSQMSIKSFSKSFGFGSKCSYYPPSPSPPVPHWLGHMGLSCVAPWATRLLAGLWKPYRLFSLTAKWIWMRYWVLEVEMKVNILNLCFEQMWWLWFLVFNIKTLEAAAHYGLDPHEI